MQGTGSEAVGQVCGLQHHREFCGSTALEGTPSREMPSWKPKILQLSKSYSATNSATRVKGTWGKRGKWQFLKQGQLCGHEQLGSASGGWEPGVGAASPVSRAEHTTLPAPPQAAAEQKCCPGHAKPSLPWWHGVGGQQEQLPRPQS